MSRPKISLHKIDLLWKSNKKQKEKSTQQDYYTMSFKLGIDNRIVKGEFTTNRHKKIMTYKAEVLFWLGLENRVK